MEHFNQFTWNQFLVLAGGLTALYFILLLLDRILGHAKFFRDFQTPVIKVVHTVLLIYEPVAILLLSSVFILIDFVFHGVMVFLLLILGFSHIRNYVSGQIIKFDSMLREGGQIKTGQFQGIIISTGKLGLQLKTHKGNHFVDYTSLIRQGYILLSGENTGGYYQLLLKPPDSEVINSVQFKTILMDKLAIAPYLDWKHKPQIVSSDKAPDSYKVKVVVKEESHLHDLVLLIRGWGYSCEITNK